MRMADTLLGGPEGCPRLTGAGLGIKSESRLHLRPE
jgi:hypothetical protein